MNVYIVWVGTSIKNKIDTALMGNSVSEIAVINQNISHGVRVIKNWVENATGRVILSEGTKGIAEVPDDALSTLVNLQLQVAQLWENEASFGVSMNLSEALRAAEVAAERGGNRIQFYTPDLVKPKEEKEPSELDSLRDLGKGENDAMGNFMEAQPEQPQQDPNQPQPDQNQQMDVKALVVQILQKIKSQKKTLDELKVVKPDTYAAILGTIQAMVLMARKMAEAGAAPEAAAPSATDQAHVAQDQQQQTVEQQQQMAMGMQQEMQGGAPPAEAQQLAQDHLNHDSAYYQGT